MREIKFRAWNKPTNRMYYWGFFYDVFQKGAADSRNFEPECNEWMQYTGLKDKNGKDIYEGDVVKIPILLPDGMNIVYHKFPIDFCEGVFFIAKLNDEPVILRESIKIANQHGGIEIIGNIWENPSLLDNANPQT